MFLVCKKCILKISMDPNTPTDSMPTPTGEKEFAKLGNHPELPPAERQKRKIIKLSIIAGAVVLVFVLVPVLILMIAKNTKPKTTDNTLVITTKPSVDPSAVSDLGPERVFIRNAASFNVPYNLAVTVPTAWDAAFTNTPSRSYPWENSTLIQALTSKFSPLSSSNTSIVSGNYIAVIDVTDWLKTDKNVVPMTIQQKQQWFNNLVGINPQNYVNISNQTANPRLSSEAGGRQHLTPVAVAENRLRGISYITNRSMNAYTPEIITMLAGTYEGKNIIIYSQHNVRDTAWANINELRERSDQETSAQTNETTADFQRGLLGADTIAIHDEYLKAINTVSLKLAE